MTSLVPASSSVTSLMPTSSSVTSSPASLLGEMEDASLHWADYIVFCSMLAVSLGIGVYQAVGGKQKTNEEYLLGNRSMGFLPVCMSLVVSYISTITLIGYPAEMFSQGVKYYWFTLGLLLGIILAVGLFIPVLYPLRLTSINEYLWLRYDSRLIQYIGTFGTVTGEVFYLGNVYYGPAVAINAVTAFPTWATIIMIGFISVIYTSIGGFKAVVYTDCFQCLIMFGGMVAVLVQAVYAVGGIENMWDLNMEWGRLDLFDFDLDPTKRITFWSGVFGNALTVLCIYGTQQSGYQRYSSLPTQSKATWSMLGMVPGNVLMQSLACLCGLAMFAYYANIGCDPKHTGIITSYNQLMPYFVSAIFSYPVIPGLFIAALFAASLSSASTCLNGTAAVLWKDVIEPFYPNLPDWKATLITKSISLLAGAFGICLGLAISMMKGGTLVQIISTFGACTGGPCAALFICGVFIPWVNNIGMGIATLLGMTLAGWISVGQYLYTDAWDPLPSPNNCSELYNLTLMSEVSLVTEISTNTNLTYLTDITQQNSQGSFLLAMYSISFLWIREVVTVFTIVLAVLISLLTGRRSPSSIEKQFMHPVVRYCCKLKSNKYTPPHSQFLHTDTSEEESMCNGSGDVKDKHSNKKNGFYLNHKEDSRQPLTNGDASSVTRDVTSC